MTASMQGVPDDAPFLRECRAAYDVWRQFVSSRWGIAVMFVWAAAEATFWPIIPDALLVPMVAVSSRRWQVVGAAILGSATGGIVMLGFAYAAPDAAHDVLARLPLVFDGDIVDARARLADDGVSAFLAQPWSGISFKVWAVEAAGADLSPWRVIPVFIAARALRMMVFAAVAALVGHWATTFVRDYSIFVMFSYVVLFSFGLWWVTTS